MNRKFYGFNSTSLVREHVAQVKNIFDLNQLRFDIKQSGTNLAVFRNLDIDGAWAIDCLAGDEPETHLFITKEALDTLGGLNETEKGLAATVTVLIQTGEAANG